VAGFWLWQVKSMEEAVEWVRRMPQEPGLEQDIELRRVFEADDFGEALTPELRAQEERQRAESAARVARVSRAAESVLPIDTPKVYLCSASFRTASKG
jgi:hypothetical protein